MKARALLNIGFKQGPVIGKLLLACKEARLKMSSQEVKDLVEELHSFPKNYFDHSVFGECAREWDTCLHPEQLYSFGTEGKPLSIWGKENIDDQTIDQMNNALSLPVSVGGAIMPDGHLGYGLNIGGVLATKDAVIPYAIGQDIACRMMCSILPIEAIEGKDDPLIKREREFIRVIEKNTRFGAGCKFQGKDRRNASVMDEDWKISLIVSQMKDTAWDQLGTSGGGNHFVDFGIIEFKENYKGVIAGKYVAILTHSGSRGPGNKIATHYSKVARMQHPHLPKQYQHLAWLPLDGDGAEYWEAMELMGRYASANHHCIHETILRDLNLDPLLQVENHHNFGFKETFNGEELIIHRKGATPAGIGDSGLIPGSMATPGFLVEGKGNLASYNSAAHGAGRAMSRRAAKDKYCWAPIKDQLKHRKVKLISGGIDEVPGAYKSIEKVMAAQEDLVEVVAKFQPRLVKMADDGFVED